MSLSHSELFTTNTSGVAEQAFHINWVLMWSKYEIIHIWTVVVDESEEWSSQ